MKTEQSWQSLAGWLSRHTDEELLIRKREQDDLDEVRLYLRGVDYREERPDAPDAYTSERALLLRGKGRIVTDGEEVELPADTFEIPLHGLNEVQEARDSLAFETERASYSLSLL